MRSNKLAGLLLIVFGSLYLGLQVLGQMNIIVFRVWDAWPLIIIALGVMFEALYFSQKKGHGFLIPGGILTTIGLLHLFESMTNWHFSAYTWPIYTFAVFVGFFQVYLVTKKQWAFIVSFILFFSTAIQSIIAINMLVRRYSGFDMAFSLIIILVGILLMYNAKQKSNDTTNQ